MGEALVIEEMQGRLFIGIESLHGDRHVGMEFHRPGRSGFRLLGDLRPVRGRLPPAPAGISVLVVGDTHQPRRKPGLPPVPRQSAIGPDEGFLSQVVGQGVVPAEEMPEEAPHRRLVPGDEFAEGVPVVGSDDPGDQF